MTFLPKSFSDSGSASSSIKYFFKTENYAKAFPTISFASNVGAAISLSMVGYIYDFFGSYIYAFIIALAMIFVSILLLMITTKTKEN